MNAAADLLVLGSGPSALGLAAAGSAQGLQVRCVAPRPEARWVQNFGSWTDELEGTLAERCVEASWAAPSVFSPGGAERILDRRYARVHTRRLQEGLRAACAAGGVVIERGSAVSVDHHDAGATVTLDDGCVREARVVVDATGANSTRPLSNAPRPTSSEVRTRMPATRASSGPAMSTAR